MRLADRIAIVTGAAGGIGRAITRRFVDEGAVVVAVDVDAAGLHTLAGSLNAGRDVVFPLTADVTSEESCAGMAQAVATRYGRADVLVNNAGIYPVQPFETMTFADWRRVMSVNLDSVFLVTRSLTPLMRGRGGRIVNVSSGTIWLGYRGVVHYAATKAALIGFTRALATELGDAGITVNAVTPGLTGTERALETFSAEAFAARRGQRALKRDETPEDVAGVILFLASSDSAFVTGQTVNVDGGLAMH